ncbi:6631_t:CDS:2 [Cetraspora pellucida]|uniref:6631_t:CDS:1 n=1 Tax=Cetraspora pellucida TaxID=1433469 RepID=A0ACA9MT03_9GLOM|nr:6631_t:CDS:2 [Cetraspora pellucida]
MGRLLLKIKIRDSSNPDNFEPETRELIIPSNVTWNKLEKEIRTLFSKINPNDEIQLKYRDFEGDMIHISSDGELSNILSTLNEDQVMKFDLVIKSQNDENKVFTYPSKKIQGKIGETVEVLISYQYLTFSHASTKDVWGTGIYTPDSDLIKALGHSGSFILPKTSQPDHDLSIILRFLPGCDKYLGSINNGLKSQDYNKFNLSFVIEHVKHLPKGSVSL